MSLLEDDTSYLCGEGASCNLLASTSLSNPFAAVTTSFGKLTQSFPLVNRSPASLPTL